ncbi:alpha/beta hydrolase [Paenibacillus polymyxa]|uniref:alpha/beta hydrolase n=1 Tax=Paenibacillus polymyxa TaxID=1406 RepID=UPI000C9F50E6|nr:alpha/beta hydrolase [Paenibacillus polymyxa]PNQ83842.1 alpha/beta hydrolase [Paenibacillus polymyxa]
MVRRLRQNLFVKLARRSAGRMITASDFKPSHAPKVHRTERMIPTSVGDSRVIVYEASLRSADPLPVFVNFHGSGFIMGSAEMDDPWCPVIAERANCVVVNVDYRLAPEHKFPIPLQESYDVTQWVYKHPDVLNIDPQRIAVGGHSAGGNLAAALCLMARDRKEFPIVYQVLDYPSLDIATDPKLKPQFEKAIPPRVVKIFNESYLRSPDEARNPLVSPIYAESLHDLPPALIITAELDSLAEEAELYAKRLIEADVPVTYKKYMGAAHAFTHSGDLALAESAWHLMSDQLKLAFEFRIEDTLAELKK